MRPKPVTVRFTETFTTEGFSEDELRLIAQFLANNPGCGTASKEIEQLRFVTWPRNPEDEPTHYVWFIAYPEVRHIEVLALTEPKDATMSSIDVARMAWRLLRLGLLIRTVYRVGEWFYDHLPHLLDIHG